MRKTKPSAAFRAPSDVNELLSSADETLSTLRADSAWAVYSRVSVLDPENPGYSLDTQPDQSETYARARGAKNILFYSDPDRSGKNSKREGLQQMYTDIKAGKVDAVVVHRIDRLYRNLESLLKFIRILRKYRVSLFSVTEDIDATSIWGRLTLAVLGHMAEAFLHQTSHNTRTGLEKRGQKGLHLGRLPLGYCNGLCSTCGDTHGQGYCPLFGGPDRLESQRGRLAVPHPVDRHVIPLIFDLYLRGHSFREIAVHLNTHQIALAEVGPILFRPRNQRESTPLQFQDESIRAILENPFFAGLIARYPRPEFSTEDDLENPSAIPVPRTTGNTRTILEIHQGLHAALISVETWRAVESLRRQKGKSPTTSSRTTRIYPLTLISRCWECFDALGQEYNLRGSTGSGISYYRCANLQNTSMKTSKKPPQDGVERISIPPDPQLLKRHATLRADKMEAQVDALMARLVIPEAWHELLMAFYLTDDGLTAFERESFNLRQSLNRYKNLYLDGDISKAEYERQSRFILGRLAERQPTASPEAQEILPLLNAFPQTWAMLTPGEKRLLLSTLFAGLYFDRHGNLRRALAYEPFDQLLKLPPDGVLE
jgi:DNA invertase Pin-like site-specific DNA recombinase